jgi:hypothetical protein
MLEMNAWMMRDRGETEGGREERGKRKTEVEKERRRGRNMTCPPPLSLPKYQVVL